MTLRAGEYYIGDLFCVMQTEWPEVVDIVYGDCCKTYKLKDGREFAAFINKNVKGIGDPLSTGIVGCINVEDINRCDYRNIALGKVIMFSERFKVGGCNGIIRLGGMIINANNMQDYCDVM